MVMNADQLSPRSEYVLLPADGIRFRDDRARKFFSEFSEARSTKPPLRFDLLSRQPGIAWDHLRLSSRLREEQLSSDFEHAIPIHVLDSTRVDGPKLLQCTDDAALALRSMSQLFRVVPNRQYWPLQSPYDLPVTRSPGASRQPPTVIRIQDGQSAAPLVGVKVVGLTNTQYRVGDEAYTDATGTADLRLGEPPIQLESLMVETPPVGYWGAYFRGAAITSPHVVGLEAVDLSATDALRTFYGSSPASSDGAGVRVGVVDSGIDLAHQDLSVRDGANTVTGEPPGDFGDSGLGHGTHVAGIIAARGAPPRGLQGLAPGADVFSYRVYGAGATSTTSYAVQKAMWAASLDGCHVINLSLGNLAPDVTLQEAFQDASEQGMVVIGAAGNGYGKPVSVPACYCVAVTALGRLGTFPANAREAADVGIVVGVDPNDFLAAFSNFGAEVDLIAPGVGILSTVPGGYAPGRGTSMAAAAATGMAARLLSARPDLLARAADRARAVDMLNYLMKSTRKMGFGLHYEGYGML
jgi:hypothetical protein